MATRGPLVLLSVAFFCLSGGAAEPSALSQSDVSFCHGGLEVLYPEMSISKCLTIPKDFREKISKVWTAPRIRFSCADETKSYALVMVDPDAPSRSNPSRAYWRHWLVVDVKGGQLRSGDVDGNILSEYARPTPPPKSGFHRYQFLLWAQPAGASLSLTEEERSSLGNWDPLAFSRRFNLGEPVAVLQFLTQNYRD